MELRLRGMTTFIFRLPVTSSTGLDWDSIRMVPLLPSEAVLAQEYSVSVATIRRSISMLNRLGFCRTYNVKGTQVTLFNDQAAFSP